MAKTDIWLPIYIGDYLKDTRHLSTIEHGAYFLILMELWMKKGSIPLKNLHRIALLSKEEWKPVWETLQDLLTIDEKNQLVSQKRLSFELFHSLDLRRKRAEIGKTGGRPPKTTENEEEANQLDNQEVNQKDNQMVKQLDNLKGKQNETSSPSPSPKKIPLHISSHKGKNSIKAALELAELNERHIENSK